MRKVYSLTLIFCCLTAVAFAKPVLPEILSDNMVLQQNAKVNIWGKAVPGKRVEICPSWTSDTVKVNVDAKGNWIASLVTPKASFTPYRISVSDGEKVILNNVLIGEVWLASGQSNMAMTLNGFANNPIRSANETIAMAGQNKGIRFVTVQRKQALFPQEIAEGIWQECTATNAPGFSAAAYYFAQTLYRALNVPVGIIVSAWGGSRVEGWTSRELLETYPEVDLSENVINKLVPSKKPMVMYNAMIYPITKYTIKGIIWYQGEANVRDYKVYGQRLADMVKLWRDNWNLGNIPFYYVEIAPFEYVNLDASAAFFREAQFKAQSLIPNSGMISTNDLVEEYEVHTIHPRNKIDVGMRLAYLALNQTYHFESVACHGPEYRSMEIKDQKIYLSFNNIENGFGGDLTAIRGFEISGDDRIFFPGSVEVDLKNKRLIISNQNIPRPVAVRYCFKNFQVGNLRNTRGLPLIPFRTDNFDK